MVIKSKEDLVQVLTKNSGNIYLYGAGAFSEQILMAIGKHYMIVLWR